MAHCAALPDPLNIRDSYNLYTAATANQIIDEFTKHPFLNVFEIEGCHLAHLHRPNYRDPEPNFGRSVIHEEVDA